MFRSRHFAVVLAAACLLTLPSVALFGQATGADPQPGTLIAVLKSDAPVFDKATACRQLAVIGNKDAVSALAALLADPQLATYARWGLENISDSAADEALREAIGRVDGDLLVGVLNSIAKRRDAKAIESLTKLLPSQNPAVVTAAAKALGAIGNVGAAEVLQKSLAEGGPGLRPAVAGACLLCAERLLQQDQRALAVALYDAVRKADVPKHLALAATHRAIVARGRDGLPLLVEQLGSGDEARFRFALQAARDLGTAASGPLTERLDAEPAARQALLILALSDIGAPAALPKILEAAQRGAKEVRIEAIAALGRFNAPAAVPTLLGAVVEQDPDIAQTARAALAVLESAEINAAIAGMLGGDHPQTLQVAVTLAGQRSIASATPALFKLVDHPDATVRVAAVKALGATVPATDLPKLIALALVPKTADLQPVASEALRAACARLPQDTCAEQLLAAMSGASPEGKISLLEQLATVGGPQALAAVVSAARSQDDALQDAATRLLGGWMTTDAAPLLLDLAKTLASGKYRIRALRGYLRIARQLNMTPEERLEVCRNALAMAERKEEQGLALETLARIGSSQALTLAVSLLKDTELKELACFAIVAMSDTVALTAPEETEKALTQVLHLATDPALKQRAEKRIVRARELAEQRRDETQFVLLFDGRTLTGWEGDPAVFRVEDGALVGGSLKKAIGTGNDFLCTKKEYRDCELRLQFKLLGENANGGVNVRSKRLPESGVASGYQADLGPGYWGCLYDEARRNRLLAKADPQPTIRADDWNEYRIRCEGPRIRLWVNGTLTVDYVEQEANLPLAGIIALQVQANRPSEAWYRNLRIREL